MITRLVAVALMAVTVLAACTGQEPQPAGTPTPAAAPAPSLTATATPIAVPTPALQLATLEVRVTDAPPEGVSKILITVRNIEVNTAQAETEAGWRTVIAEPKSFDLVALTGVEAVLGSAQLQPGRYNQVRMEVVKALITIQGEEKAATVPSDKLRIVGGFELVAGQATVLTLDFDAEKSVVLRGRQEPLLKPVVKLLARKGGQPKAEAKEVSETPAPTATPTATATPTPTPATAPVPSPTATATPIAVPTPALQLATLEVRVTDAPPEGVSKILITVQKIEVNTAQAETEAGWRTVIAEPKSFDLVALTGIEAILGSAQLQPGRYNQVRMEVVNALITIQGEEKAATVPSDKLRIVGGFELVAGQATVLTLDFDAEKSVVLRGRQEPLLKPVVKLLARKGGQPKAEAKEVSEAPAPTPTLTPTPTATPTATATSAGLQTVQITTSGFTFVPNLVTVTKGETVRFILTVPDFQHTLTFQVTNKSVDLTLTQPGTLTSEPVPFNEVQQVRFVCRFHEPFGMAGTINVVER